MSGMKKNFKLASVLILAFAMLYTPSPASAVVNAQATAVITGFKTNDLNGNGILDPGDLPLAGWTVIARNSTNDIIASDITANNGFYSLTIPNNQGGIITVSEELQPGWIQTFPKPPSVNYTFNIPAASGLTLLNNNFSNFKLGSISGMKFNDLNGNSLLDACEPGLGGWTIFLNGTDTITNTPVNLNTVTAPDGTFSFTGLTNGTYTLGEVVQPGWVQTFRPAPVDIRSGTVSTGSVIGNHNNSAPLTVTPNILNVSISVATPITFNVTSGCTLVPNAVVSLSGAGVTASGTTDNTGRVVISVHALSPGIINVTATKTVVGNFGIIDFVPGNATIAAVGGGVMGQKFNDLNGNGIMDPGEIGLPGWTIRIIGLNVPIQRTTVTDAGGNYIFPNIPVGIYLVMEITQVGWLPTTRTSVIVRTITVGQTIVVNFGNRRL